MPTKSNIIICPSCRHENIEGSDVCENCMADLHAVSKPGSVQVATESELGLPVSSMRLSKPRTVSPESSVRDAIAAMKDDPLGAVVVTQDGAVAGIFTERDVLKRIAGQPQLLSSPVSAYMTADPVVLHEDDLMAVALNKMGDGGFRHIPITRDGQLVGMVTARDVMAWVLGRYFD